MVEVEKTYGVLFDCIVENLDHGCYLLKPLAVISGEYDDKIMAFTDNAGLQYAAMEDDTAYCERDEKVVGYVVSEKKLLEMYPDAETIDDATGQYMLSFLDIKIEAIHDIENESVKIIKTPYDSIIYGEDDDFTEGPIVACSTSSSKKDEDKKEIKKSTKDEELSRYDKMFVDGNYVVFTYEELKKLYLQADINKITTFLKNKKKDKESSKKNLEGSLDKCYFMSDKDITALSKKSYDEIHETICNLFMNKNNFTKDFINNYKYSFGMFMMCNNRKELNDFLKNQLNYYKKLLNKINDLKDINNNSKALTFIKKELNNIDKLNLDNTLKNIKDEYRNLYINQLKELDETILTLMDLNIPNENDSNYDEIFKERSLIEIMDSVQTDLEELSNLIGLENAKEEINMFIKMLKFNMKTKDILKPVPLNLNMIFTGNAGTGKTTVAEIVSKMFYKLGYITSDKSIACTANSLIASYVGQTAEKTARLINEYKCGTIFIDEAYVLSAPGQEFGPEAIVEILKELEKNRTVFIFAGYTKEMKEFIASNSGIKSRIGINLEFKDYSEQELTQMLVNLFNKYGYILEDGLQEKFIDIFRTAKEVPNFGNGRFVKEAIFNRIIKEHACNTDESFDKNALKTIVANDISKDILKKDEQPKEIGFKVKIKN